MRAVILAAGEGRRMRPLTYTRPKPLLPVGGKPILEHLISNLKKAGVNKISIIVGHYSDKVKEHFGDGERFGVKIEYILQRKQLGTGDALNTARDLLKEDVFLLLNGDVIFGEGDIRAVMEGEPPAIGVFEGSGIDVGVVEIRRDEVRRVVEKPSLEIKGPINAGIYLFDRRIFDFLSRIEPSPRGEYEITDAIQLMIDGGIKVRWRNVISWLNITYPWDLLKVNETLLRDIEPENKGVVEDGAVIKGKVRIGEGSVVRSGSYIEGPVIIGEGCEIGPNSYIRPCTYIGDGCHIGSACEVKNSIIMRGTKIPHHNYVGDSIIGEGCNLGAGTKIANLKLRNGNVRINDKDTGLRKLGAIIGDGVKTGINASINVGTLIGNDTLIGPGVLVSGVINPRSVII